MTENKGMNYDKYIMYLSTIEGTPIKVLTESLVTIMKGNSIDC